MKILDFSISTDTFYAGTGLRVVIKKDGYTRTAHLMQALEDQWRKSYNHCWILHDNHHKYDKSLFVGEAFDSTCSIKLEHKYFESWYGHEDNYPDFYISNKKTKGILFATFGLYSQPTMPSQEEEYAVQFCVDGSIYYRNEYDHGTYTWAIPINSIDRRIDLDFLFDFTKAYDAEKTDYLSDEIKFDISLKYIHA